MPAHFERIGQDHGDWGDMAVEQAEHPLVSHPAGNDEELDPLNVLHVCDGDEPQFDSRPVLRGLWLPVRSGGLNFTTVPQDHNSSSQSVADKAVEDVLESADLWRADPESTDRVLQAVNNPIRHRTSFSCEVLVTQLLREFREVPLLLAFMLSTSG
jgi:hypothetical protein